MRNLVTITITMAVAICLAAPGLALTPAQKCQSSKNKLAGKYDECLQKAEANKAAGGTVLVYTNAVAKCIDKLMDKLSASEDKATAAGGACPTMDDAALLRGFLQKQAQTVAAALQVGASLFSAGADMRNTDIHGALLDGDLTGVDLRGANLTNVFATGVIFTNANFTGANLHNMNLEEADLTNADLTSADLTSLFAVNLLGCPIPATLPAQWSCIQNSLVGPGAVLYRAHLNNANLSNVNLTNSPLLDAQLTNVTWNHTTCPDGTRSDTNGSSPESCCAHTVGGAPASCSP